MKGLKFGLPPTKVDKFSIFATFETCYNNFKCESINGGFTEERFQNKFADNAYMYCQYYNKKNEQNLTDNELEGLKELRMDRSIVILKADKGKCVVLLRKSDYNNDLETMLQDESKFRVLKEDPTIKRENKLIQHLLKLKKDGDITEQFYKKVRPNGSQPARLYGLPKVHKNNHPLRPICSSVNAYNYKLASELASIISPYAISDFSVKNTFTFVEEINQLSYPGSFLCSFDVSSLFTMIPLDETIEITLDYVFENKEKVEGLSRVKLEKTTGNGNQGDELYF